MTDAEEPEETVDLLAALQASINRHRAAQEGAMQPTPDIPDWVEAGRQAVIIHRARFDLWVIDVDIVSVGKRYAITEHTVRGGSDGGPSRVQRNYWDTIRWSRRSGALPERGSGERELYSPASEEVATARLDHRVYQARAAINSLSYRFNRTATADQYGRAEVIKLAEDLAGAARSYVDAMCARWGEPTAAAEQ